MKDTVEAYQPRATKNKVWPNWKFVSIVSVIWLFVIHFCERTYPQYVTNKCQWNKWEADAPDHHRVAVIADPQIIDDYSYPKFPRWFQRVFEFTADNYLRRNYQYTEGLLDPDTVIFLGDLYDGGREWNTTETKPVWFNEYKRFSSIFPFDSNRRHILSVPGNHDIGFENVTVENTHRFAQYFGELNSVLEIGNHSIIMVDTISLSHKNPEINSEPNHFLETFTSHLQNPESPRILLTHVPLYRWPDRQQCGPLRERKHKLFPLMKGYQYQTVIEYEVSKRLLSTVAPVLVLGGDDHDYCDIQQTYTTDNGEQTAREITVKAAGMTGGVKFPAIQLLSLHAGAPESYSTEMCFMPTPYLSLKTYGYWYLATIGFLAFLYLFPNKLNHFTKRTNQLLNDTNLKRRWYYWVDEDRSVLSFAINAVLVTVVPVTIWWYYVVSLYVNN